MRARELLRAEMKKKNITVAKLNELLTEDQQGLGSDRALHTKISRGSFSADWFLGCMRLMKINKLRIEKEDKND